MITRMLPKLILGIRLLKMKNKMLSSVPTQISKKISNNRMLLVLVTRRRSSKPNTSICTFNCPMKRWVNWSASIQLTFLTKVSLLKAKKLKRKKWHVRPRRSSTWRSIQQAFLRKVLSNLLKDMDKTQFWAVIGVRRQIFWPYPQAKTPMVKLQIRARKVLVVNRAQCYSNRQSLILRATLLRSKTFSSNWVT